MTQAQYPKGHPRAGQFIPTGKVDPRRLRAMLRSAVLSTDPAVHEILDDYQIINPDATKRRRGAGTPVPVSSETVMDGTVHDIVQSSQGEFYRRREGVYATCVFERIRFQSEKPVSDDEIAHALQIIGYAWKQNMATGISLTRAERDSGRSFVVYADAWESQRTDVRACIGDFEGDVLNYLSEGTPMRTSNRIDPATQKSMMGTRLVDALPGNHTFDIYYDDVEATPYS